MRRKGHLMEIYSSKKTFDKSLLDASRHKRSRPSVQRCFSQIDGLYDYVSCKKSIDGNYQRKIVSDEASGKTRDNVYVPSFFPTQIQQHMERTAIEPALANSLWYLSCGSVIDKGPSLIIRTIRKYCRTRHNELKYFIKFDIRKYYDSVSHEVLEDMISKKIKDSDMLNMIKSDIEECTKNNKGLKIGTFTSPLFANFFLTDFDHWVKENLTKECGITLYPRYVDDFVFFGSNKRKLEKSIILAQKYLANIGLRTHENECLKRFSYKDKNGSYKGEPLDYVGYKFYQDHIEIRKRDWKRIRRCLIRIKHLYETKQRIPTTLVRRFWSYWGYIVNSNSKGLQKKYLSVDELKMLKELAKRAGKEEEKWRTIKQSRMQHPILNRMKRYPMAQME